MSRQRFTSHTPGIVVVHGADIAVATAGGCFTPGCKVVGEFVFVRDGAVGRICRLAVLTPKQTRSQVIDMRLRVAVLIGHQDRTGQSVIAIRLLSIVRITHHGSAVRIVIRSRTGGLEVPLIVGVERRSLSRRLCVVGIKDQCHVRVLIKVRGGDSAQAIGNLKAATTWIVLGFGEKKESTRRVAQ